MRYSSDQWDSFSENSNFMSESLETKVGLFLETLYREYKNGHNNT